MRRLAPGYIPRGKYIKKEKVPFQELLPLKLKMQVSSKGEKKSSAQCLQEMSVFFACLKKNNFEEKHCGKELDSFQKCVANVQATMSSQTSLAKRGTLVPGEKNLSHHQVTALLKKFPDPKK